MRGTCTQPILFPPLYMVERLSHCDVAVIMEEAQHSRSSGHSWLQYTTEQGVRKASIPCASKNRARLCDIELLDPGSWNRNLLTHVRATYRKCMGYQEVMPRFETLMWDTACMETLLDYSDMTMQWTLEMFGLPVRLHRSRQLVLERPDFAPEWLSELSRAVGITHYVQGEKSIQSYFKPGYFGRYGISVWGQAWQAPSIPHLGPEWNSQVSALDALFVAGVNGARKLIASSQPTVVRMAAFD